MIAAYGEPFGDYSAAAVWALAREVRRHVTPRSGGTEGRAVRGLRSLPGSPAVLVAAAIGSGSCGPARDEDRIQQGFTRARRDRMTRVERFLVARGSSSGRQWKWLACFALDQDDQALRGPPSSPQGRREVHRGALDRLARWYDGAKTTLDDVSTRPGHEPARPICSSKWISRRWRRGSRCAPRSWIQSRASRHGHPGARQLGMRTGKKILRKRTPPFFPRRPGRLRKGWLRPPWTGGCAALCER